MSNCIILWKTSIFTWIQILLCIVPHFVPSAAFQYLRGRSYKNVPTIPNDEVEFEIFDEKVNDLENKLYESMQETENFFDSEAGVALDAALTVASFVPYLQQAAVVAGVIRGLLAEESDWKENFEKTVAHETRREIALGDLRWMEAYMETFRRKFVLMAENNTDLENRKTIASNFHTKIDQMLNFFAHRDSLFKKFPLIGAPLLIEFAELIAFFDPVVKALIPLEAVSPEHTCVVHNIMLDYLPRTINARLEKLHLTSSVMEPSRFYETSYILEKTLEGLAHDDYNITLPPEIRCIKGCFTNFVMNRLDIALDFAGDLCLKDDFGAEYAENEDCILDYSLLIRQPILELFPVDLVNDLCDNPLQPTGFGWFTIKLRELRAHMSFDDRYCDGKFNPCDPFVIMHINDEFQFQTPSKPDTCCYNADYTYTTGNISKNSMVKLEVWDEDPNEQSTLIITTTGTIESFLTNGHRSVKLSSNYENSINTVSFWQDDYK